MDNLGYCCINQTLRNKKPIKESVYCSRSITKKKFTIEEASKRALQNCNDLLRILNWNERHGIRVFRISSDLFPRYTCPDHGYDLNDLPDRDGIKFALRLCGDFALICDHQLSFHPGPFTTLASHHEVVRQNGIREVEYHTLLVDLIDTHRMLDIPINFHIGGSYGREYEATAERFIDSFKQLSKRAQKLTVLENDDKPSGWSVWNLYKHIYSKTGIPITFDIHHWQLRNDGYSINDDFNLARGTWGGRSMQVHYSQSSTPNKRVNAHSDYYRDPIPEFIANCDNIHIHLESKAKELALLKYRHDYGGSSYEL